MNMREYLKGEEDKGLMETSISDLKGDLSLEVLALAYNTINSLVNAGILAMRIFGQDVPDDIGEEIRAEIEKVRGVIRGYCAGQVDAAGVRTAVKEGRARATKVREALKAPRT
jgi:hypothetical protein